MNEPMCDGNEHVWTEARLEQSEEGCMCGRYPNYQTFFADMEMQINQDYAARGSFVVLDPRRVNFKNRGRKAVRGPVKDVFRDILAVYEGSKGNF